MTFSVIREFKIKGHVQAVGSILKLSTDQAARLAGYVESVTHQACQLMNEIAGRDPGGDCWQWMKTNRPDLWRSHMRALHDDDITAARLTFNEMLTAWEQRQ